MLRGLDDGDGLAEARSFDGRSDTAGGASVNDNVVIVAREEIRGPRNPADGGYQNNRMCCALDR